MFACVRSGEDATSIRDNRCMTRVKETDAVKRVTFIARRRKLMPDADRILTSTDKNRSRITDNNRMGIVRKTDAAKRDIRRTQLSDVLCVRNSDKAKCDTETERQVEAMLH